MDPPAAAAAPPPLLPAAAAERLYNCISGMTADSWRRPDTLQGTLRNTEGLLCALRGCDSMAQYLELVSGSGGGGSGPCTSVWTSGTIAYRCRTCGMSPSAAICLDCFRPDDHEGHDYVMYTSDAGGCCDCGDMSSWRPEGCCPRHRPPGEGQGAGAAAAPCLPADEEVVVRAIVECAIARLQLALEGSLLEGSAASAPTGGPSAAQEREAALRLIHWLVQLSQQPLLRVIVCEQLMQPASAAAQAALGVQPTVSDTSGLVSSEAAAVAGLLQRQAAGLLAGLEQVLPQADDQPSRPLPQLPPGQEPEPPPQPQPPPQQQRPNSLLYWMMSTLLPQGARLVEELASLLILLLYSVPFKEHFGRFLLCFYPHWGALGKRHAVTKALDRLTVQVFHLEEPTLALTQHCNLLEVLLTGLLGVLRQGLDEDGKLDGDSEQLSGRLYLRIAADLHMCLSHPAVVMQLLAGSQAPLLSTHVLEVFRLIQGASPFTRKSGEHVLYESTAWMNVVQVEVHMMHMLKQGLLHTLLKAAEAGSIPPEAAAQALAFGLHRCLEAVEAAAAPMQAAEEPHSFLNALLKGQAQISAHIPLERLAAAFLAGLLHMAHTSSQPGPFLAAAADALGSNPLLPVADKEAAVRRWEMCGLAAGRVISWMSQIRQGLWVRNGQQLLRLEAFYSSPYWSDHGLDCDLLAIQAWLASTADLSRSLEFFMMDSCAGGLLKVTTAATLEEAAAKLAAARQSQEMQRCTADWFRMLVSVLQERTLWHPTYSPLKLRRAIIHLLAAGARSHSEVSDELPYELAHSTHFDKVLTDVADYRPATASSMGHYTLKRECWREFDPFYLHYTRRDLQSALHTAQETGVWQPHWQLQQGLPPLPSPMAGLRRVLHHLLPLTWASLVLACSDSEGTAGGGSSSGGAADDCALAATSLLSLALHGKSQEIARLFRAGSSSNNTAAALSAAATPEASPSPPCGLVQEVVEPLGGSPPARPGILFLLRVLAGSQTWVDGSMREAAWELKDCAAAAAALAQQLLHAAEQHGPEAQQQPAAGEQPSGAAAASADQQAGMAAEGQRQSARKQQGKQRQQHMLVRMRAQQARAAAALMDEAEEPLSDAAAQPEQQAGPLADMDIGTTASQPPAAAAAAAPSALSGQQPLPAHHPAAWEQQPGAECGLCHCGSSATMPLGLVAQMQVTELPVMASADPAGPLTPEHPGQPGAAIGAGPESAAGGGTVSAFPTAAAGPGLSVFDLQPSLHLLCCGHMLHASCLERYRSSWRQRTTAGQDVEGFQLLQTASSAGEYLCPICRRLGNCLLPFAPAAEAVPEGAPEQQPLSSQAALQQLQRLILDDSNWVAAPVTSDSQLLQQWQQACGVMAPSEPAAPNSLQLVPLLGCHAAGIAALTEFAKLSGTDWLLQQHRLLEWLQHRGAGEHEPLWGIPVAPAAAGQPAAHEPEQPAVQAALPLLQRAAAAAGDEAVAGALGAAANALVQMDTEQPADWQQQGGELSSEEEEEEEEEVGAAITLEAGVTVVFELLQQQAATDAIAAAAAAGQHALGLEAAIASLQAAACFSQHIRRLRSSTAGGILWSLLGSGISQWEVAHRDPACMPSAEVDAAHWRAMQSLTQLALAASAACLTTMLSPVAATRPLSSNALLAFLQQLDSGSLVQLGSVSPISTMALLPSLLQLQWPPSADVAQHVHDPFALLLELLAALLNPPMHQLDASLPCRVHRQPLAVMRGLLALLFPLAASQAVAHATWGVGSAADAIAAMQVSSPLAHAIASASSSQLLPWLQRAAVLTSLLSGKSPPASPPLGLQSASSSAAAVLRELRLQPLQAALQSSATASLLLKAHGSDTTAGVQMSICVGPQQWTVVAMPLPPAAKLLSLPSSYQKWFLSLGTKRCSACSQLPSEPAMCLRCGTVLCCGSRRCKGPPHWGMCYTHSQACGGGTCSFLLSKMTRVLFIRKNRATFLASPYVDSHGEEDVRLQRGRPLFLHDERLEHLVQLWRGAALDFDSQVLHLANRRSESAYMY